MSVTTPFKHMDSFPFTLPDRSTALAPLTSPLGLVEPLNRQELMQIFWNHQNFSLSVGANGSYNSAEGPVGFNWGTTITSHLNFAPYEVEPINKRADSGERGLYPRFDEANTPPPQNTDAQYVARRLYHFDGDTNTYGINLIFTFQSIETIATGVIITDDVLQPPFVQYGTGTTDFFGKSVGFYLFLPSDVISIISLNYHFTFSPTYYTYPP